MGYTILIFSYLFLIITYVFFASSFSHEKELDCVVGKLLECVPEELHDSEDISDYLLLLNTMQCWNKKAQYWEGVKYLFEHICKQAKQYTSLKMFILCCYFYDTMYIKKNTEDYDRASLTLKDYVIYMDMHGWEQKHYLILWGMLHCLLRECDRDNAVYFITWYMNYPVRSQRIYEKSGHTISEPDRRKQIGILLIELKIYLNHQGRDEVDDCIWRELVNIWNEGKDILGSGEDILRQEYLRISTIGQQKKEPDPI